MDEESYDKLDELLNEFGLAEILMSLSMLCMESESAWKESTSQDSFTREAASIWRKAGTAVRRLAGNEAIQDTHALGA